MNSEGILDNKDLEILRLEEIINKYKQYDTYRKKYYSNALLELGELKSYTLELEDILNNKYNKIQCNKDKELLYNQRKELKNSNKALFKYKRKVEELEKEISKLKEIINSLQEVINSIQ